MSARPFLLAMLLLAALPVDAAGPGSTEKPGNKLDFNALPPMPKNHGGGTKCALCHTTDGWLNVSFPHEKTGFVLRGQHQRTACRACHPEGFNTPVANTCQACHRDVHEGNFGTLCASCHEETSWKPTFSVDAHRRTNFPLAGAHATLPCLECHTDARDRTFSPAATAPCLKCHEADYKRTELGNVKHVALGFSTNCRECHEAGTFARGQFFAHDKCFGISHGDHAGIRCESCHTSLTTAMASGTCETRTASCTNCHEHSCSRTDSRHTKVPGYQCKDRKCYECHRFTTK